MSLVNNSLSATHLIAACAEPSGDRACFRYKNLALLSLLGALTACANVGTSVGISVPIGRVGGVGVSIGSGGTVSGSVGVGAGGGSVSVGATGQLPRPADPQPAADTSKKVEKKD